MQQACLFCRIIQHETPADFMHEDDLVVAFKDLRPQAPIHFLVVSKKHIATLNDLQPEDSPLIGCVQRRLRKPTGSNDFSIVTTYRRLRPLPVRACRVLLVRWSRMERYR
ncbi:MAG: hypothetical protein DMG19_08600 [Acidobacteria bacterium]|nr:MAG: hypothetical protein DMG19_08600 [Acidobacteriota bacterium]